MSIQGKVRIYIICSHDAATKELRDSAVSLVRLNIDTMRYERIPVLQPRNGLRPLISKVEAWEKCDYLLSGRGDSWWKELQLFKAASCPFK